MQFLFHLGTKCAQTGTVASLCITQVVYIITALHNPINYRLQGYREKLRLIDPTADMIITRQEAARDVKLAEAEHHRVTAVAHSMPPKKAHPFSNITITTDHR